MYPRQRITIALLARSSIAMIAPQKIGSMIALQNQCGAIGTHEVITIVSGADNGCSAFRNGDHRRGDTLHELLHSGLAVCVCRSRST